MTTRIHTNIVATISAAAAIAAAVVAPCASAGPSKGTHVQIPPSLVNFREPGSTGYVPNAAHVTIPPRLAGFREPGSTGYVPGMTGVSIPSRLAHFREPGSTGFVPTPAAVTAAASYGGGFDWVSALIGAGAALGITLAAAGALKVLRKRHPLAHA